MLILIKGILKDEFSDDKAFNMPKAQEYNAHFKILKINANHNSYYVDYYSICIHTDDLHCVHQTHVFILLAALPFSRGFSAPGHPSLPNATYQPYMVKLKTDHDFVGNLTDQRDAALPGKITFDDDILELAKNTVAAKTVANKVENDSTVMVEPDTTLTDRETESCIQTDQSNETMLKVDEDEKQKIADKEDVTKGSVKTSFPQKGRLKDLENILVPASERSTGGEKTATAVKGYLVEPPARGSLWRSSILGLAKILDGG